MKKYKAGMYGGKFMPMHLGHLHCLENASKLCEKVYLLLVIGGAQDQEISETDHREFLSVEARLKQVHKAAAMFDNVIPKMVDVSTCRDENGEEDWDKETPIILNELGFFDAVFGSEPEYEPYFKRAYPWADYVLVDVDRTEVPISATKIRNMKDEMEAKQWIV